MKPVHTVDGLTMPWGRAGCSADASWGRGDVIRQRSVVGLLLDELVYANRVGAAVVGCSGG